MLCDGCYARVYSQIMLLKGHTMNCMDCGCDGGECTGKLRKIVDEYYGEVVTKLSEEKNKESSLSSAAER